MSMNSRIRTVKNAPMYVSYSVEKFGTTEKLHEYLYIFLVE